MVATREAPDKQKAVYQLQGTLLEACSCDVLCPCWIGEDPDQGDCKAFIAYHFNSGQINGVDVSGLSLVNVVHIPGNALTPGSWKLLMFVDGKATPEQKEALVGALTGQLGGPLADLAALVGEVVGIESAEITHEIQDGGGTLRVGDAVYSQMEPYRSGDGTVTTLRDSIFSTVPGSPAYVSKAAINRVNLPRYGMVWEFAGRNAIQSDYRMEHFA